VKSNEEVLDLARKYCENLGISLEDVSAKAENYGTRFESADERERALREMLDYLFTSLKNYEEVKHAMTINQSTAFLERWQMAAEVFQLAVNVDEEIKNK
jgi:hypothetical protein